ncbi:hypothetical protein [Novosphingobium sp.]|uniref:hypothetical protein n=1 Tax=Novosphingobium sp. TaxID=1874826 RepID=UPI0025FEB1DE|nr:hypothetical protein [Novosphingobium sp.]
MSKLIIFAVLSASSAISVSHRAMAEEVLFLKCDMEEAKIGGDVADGSSAPVSASKYSWEFGSTQKKTIYFKIKTSQPFVDHNDKRIVVNEWYEFDGRQYSIKLFSDITPLGCDISNCKFNIDGFRISASFSHSKNWQEYRIIQIIDRETGKIVRGDRLDVYSHLISNDGNLSGDHGTLTMDRYGFCEKSPDMEDRPTKF